MQEIEVIKKVLFDKEKMVLFDFVSKPSFKMCIRPDEKFLKFDDLDNPVKLYDKNYIDNVYHYYDKIKNKINKHYETRELLKLVTSEINFFD